MKVKVTKLTDIDLLRKACESTMHGKESKLTLDNAYRCMHSVIRTQIFYVEMVDIPTFVSVHFVRHSQGVTHFVKSNRDDRGGSGTEDRLTPVTHSFICNAETLINMARKRLCLKAHEKTIEAMKEIKVCVSLSDPDLGKYMVPECEFRGNKCHELKPCGRFK